MIHLPWILKQEMLDHGMAADPEECCGLLGGTDPVMPTSIYRLRNLSRHPRVAYDAAPEDLFAAQRKMRGRGETLFAIYHSHPRSTDPRPSESDTRLAYYPAAIYFIIGLGPGGPILRAFKLSEKSVGWDSVDFEVVNSGTYVEPLVGAGRN